MTTPPHSLARFFAPEAVAIIGASPEKTKIRGQLLHVLRKNGYAGRLYPVNPSYVEIDGVSCFPSIAAIGAPIDLALVAIPSEAVLPALAECAAAGVRHVVIISSGFAEQGGDQSRLQDEIAALARRTGMRISGPNAEGFHNEIAHVAATFSPAVDAKPGEEMLQATGRRISIVAQSGGMGFALYNRGRAQGLSFSYVVSTGNEADLTASDFIDFMAEEEATAMIMLFLEGVRDPEKFIAAAEAAARGGKPVIAAKMGRSTAGERAAASHTASMAGWNTAYDAVFHKYGIISAADPDEAVAIAAAFATCPPARGNRVAVVTTSGGAGAWAADALAAAGMELPELSADLQRAIRRSIPAFGSARNPVDITAQAVHTGGLLRSIELLSVSDEVDAIVVVVSLASQTRMTIDLAALKAIVGARQKPLLFYSYTLPSFFARKALATAGVTIHTSLAALGSAVKALARAGAFRLRAPLTLAAPSPRIAAALAQGRRGFSEHEAREILALSGIALPPYRLVAREEELDNAASALGFPLALKIQSPDIAHKTEIGGVRLGIADMLSLREAFAEVMEAARRHRPEARLQGVLLQRMVPRGVEMILGTIRDPIFGPLIMVGAGGVMTELFRDAAYRLAPADRAGAEEMLDELRVAALLGGFRGAPACDRTALVDLIVELSRFAATYSDQIAEIDLNPVIVHPVAQGCTILDVLLTVQAGNNGGNSP